MRSNLPAAILGLLVLAAALLAGGFYESTYSLLAAIVCLALAASAALLAPPRPSAAVALLLALAAWTALSGLWGQAGAAFRVVPLVVLYAAVLYAAEWIGGERLLLAAGAAVGACLAIALGARALGVEPDAAGPATDRLAWPLGYSNGLALLAVYGVVLAAGLPSARPRLSASLAAGAAAALYLTYSRSGLLIAAAAAVLLLALRPESARALAAALAAIGVVAGLDALGAPAVAAILLAPAIGALVPPLRLRLPRRALAALAIPLVAAAALVAQPLAARFAAPAPDERDARRLLDVSGHGRAELWGTAWNEGAARPLAGGGAGTWPRAYIDETGSLAGPANAHSLYLETFAELGIVGVVLLVGALAIPLLRRSRDPWAPAATALVAAYAAHAALDWDWQLPAVTIPALLAGASVTRAGVKLGPGPATLAAVAALTLGAAAGAHGLGAALLETGVETEGEAKLVRRLLPYDARPDTALAAAAGGRGRIAGAALARACRTDAAEPMLRRSYPSNGGCPS